MRRLFGKLLFKHLYFPIWGSPRVKDLICYIFSALKLCSCSVFNELQFVPRLSLTLLVSLVSLSELTHFFGRHYHPRKLVWHVWILSGFDISQSWGGSLYLVIWTKPLFKHFSSASSLPVLALPVLLAVFSSHFSCINFISCTGGTAAQLQHNRSRSELWCLLFTFLTGQNFWSSYLPTTLVLVFVVAMILVMVSIMVWSWSGHGLDGRGRWCLLLLTGQDFCSYLAS